MKGRRPAAISVAHVEPAVSQYILNQRLERLQQVAQQVDERLSSVELEYVRANGSPGSSPTSPSVGGAAVHAEVARRMEELMEAQAALSTRLDSAERGGHEHEAARFELSNMRDELSEQRAALEAEARAKDTEVRRLQDALAAEHSRANALDSAMGRAGKLVEDRVALAHKERDRAVEAAMHAAEAQLVAERAAADARRREKAISRMRQLEVARGWNTWTLFLRDRGRLRRAVAKVHMPVEMWGMRRWQEEVRVRHTLKQTAGRLRSPAVSRALRVWRVAAVADATKAHESAERLARESLRRELSAQLRAREAHLEAEVTRLNAAHAEETRRMAAQMAAADTAAATALSAAEAARVKQQQERTFRRMRQLEIARGYRSWLACVDERQRLRRATSRLRHPGLGHAWRRWAEMMEERRRLRQIAARACAPALSQAFRRWRRMATAAARYAQDAVAGRTGQLERRCFELEQQAVEREAKAAERVQELAARVAELELEQRGYSEADAARAVRRQEQALRRLSQLELSRGYRSWAARIDERERLRRATSRLRHPGLGHAWRRWAEMMEERRRLLHTGSAMRSPAQSYAFGRWRQAAKEAARYGVRAFISSLEERLRDAVQSQRHLEETLRSRDEEHAREVERMREQVDEYERAAGEALALDDAKAKRQQERAVRRMGQLELARGYGAWVSWWGERQQLRRATSRLRHPGLSHSWLRWAEMMEERRRIRQMASRVCTPGLSHAFGQLLAHAREVAVRRAEARRRDSERRFADLQRQCEEVRMELAERDAHNASVRRRLDDALAAGRSVVDDATLDADSAPISPMGVALSVTRSPSRSPTSWRSPSTSHTREVTRFRTSSSLGQLGADRSVTR